VADAYRPDEDGTRYLSLVYIGKIEDPNEIKAPSLLDKLIKKYQVKDDPKSRAANDFEKWIYRNFDQNEIKSLEDGLGDNIDVFVGEEGGGPNTLEGLEGGITPNFYDIPGDSGTYEIYDYKSESYINYVAPKMNNGGLNPTKKRLVKNREDSIKYGIK
jgi:hypothetical protein